MIKLTVLQVRRKSKNKPEVYIENYYGNDKKQDKKLNGLFNFRRTKKA